MTERSSRSVSRSDNRFRVGKSFMEWRDGGLDIHVHETCSPLPFPLRGSIRLMPGTLHDAPVSLDPAGRHQWRAVAPRATIDVQFSAPGLHWQGSAYHDMNWGDEPLEAAFRDWTWLRAETPAGTTVLYDVTARDGARHAFGRTFLPDGTGHHALPPSHQLPRGLWGMARPVLSEQAPRLKATLEDAPFYTRNHVEITLGGAPREAVHESLSLTRFTHPVVQWMLPFRMPRKA